MILRVTYLEVLPETYTCACAAVRDGKSTEAVPIASRARPYFIVNRLGNEMVVSKEALFILIS